MTTYKNTGSIDQDGLNHPNWAGATNFNIKWQKQYTHKTPKIQSIDAHTYRVCITLESVTPNFYPETVTEVVKWYPSSTWMQQSCSDKYRVYDQQAVEHEEAHIQQITDIIKKANSNWNTDAFTPTACATSKIPGSAHNKVLKTLEGKIDAYLAEQSKPIIQEVNAVGKEYHEEHKVPPMECSGCP
jgi:hypothetical protein